MDPRKIVLKETGVIAVGTLIGTVLMYLIFVLIGHFDKTVLLGGIVGSVLSILNFFLMAVSAMSAADKAAAQDVKGGKTQIKLSYTMRILLIFVLLFACVKSGLCNPIAAVAPLLFVRPTITLREFFRKPRNNEA